MFRPWLALLASVFMFHLPLTSSFCSYFVLRPKIPVPYLRASGQRRAVSWLPLSVSMIAAEPNQEAEVPTSAAAMVQGATRPEECFEASMLLPYPGEETMHWERQPHHQKKRLKTAVNAIRKLAKLSMGAGGVEMRRQIWSHPSLERLCGMAACTVDGDDQEIRSVCDALTSLGVLRAGNSSPPPAHATKMAVLCSEKVRSLTPSQLSSAHWACQRLGLLGKDPRIDAIERVLEDMRLPFAISVGLLEGVGTMEDVLREVPFKYEKLKTRSGVQVDERRATCWMAEDGIGGFAYSGKIMAPVPFTKTVGKIRDALYEATNVRYDCALLNHYPDSSVACQWHTDPDHGSKWALDAAIVSMGDTRRFSMREYGRVANKEESEMHTWHVFDGDVVHMRADCQDRFEHCVMKAEGELNKGPRVSLVFKKSLLSLGRKAGHGVEKERDRDARQASRAAAGAAPRTAAAAAGKRAGGGVGRGGSMGGLRGAEGSRHGARGSSRGGRGGAVRGGAEGKGPRR